MSQNCLGGFHRIFKMQNYYTISIIFVLVLNLKTRVLAQSDVSTLNGLYYFPSVSNILDYITLFPNRYTVHFQTTKSFLFINYPYWLYFRCFPCTFLFTEQLHTFNVSIKRFQQKFEQKCDVVIVENLPGGMDTQNTISLRNTYNFALFTTTIYLVYYYHAMFLPSIEMYTPATKIMITRRFTAFGMVDVGFVICNQFCKPTSYNMQHPTVIHQTLHNTMQLHKFLFRTGNGRQAHAHRIGIHLYYSMVHKTSRYLCSEIVGTAKLNKIAMFCDDNILAVIQLAKLHNMSIELLGPEDPFEGDVSTQLLNQYSVLAKRTPSKRTYRMISESTYSRDAYWSLINCKLKFAEANYKLWLNGYPQELWIILGLGFVFAISQKCESIISITGVMVGQEITLHSKKISYLIVLAFFGRSLYENTITSDVMAPIEPSAYTNLREMILDNVKILVHQTFLWDTSFADKAAPDFRRSGIEHLVNQSYEITRADNSDEDSVIEKMLRQHGKKFAYVAPEGKTDFLVQRIGNLLLKRSHKSHRCYRLKQRLHSNFLFWLLHTINNHWLAESLMRMKDSGLLNAWDDWRDYLYALRTELILQSRTTQFCEVNFQVVQLSHLFSVVLLCLAVYYVAMFVFIVEYRACQNSRRFNKLAETSTQLVLQQSQFYVEHILGILPKSVRLS